MAKILEKSKVFKSPVMVGDLAFYEVVEEGKISCKVHRSNVEVVKSKAVISGDIIEIYEYSKGYSIGGETPNKAGRKGVKQVTEEEKDENRAKVLDRAKKTIRRLINTNVAIYPNAKFVTLTFKENIQDLKFANNEFKKFIQRLNYQMEKMQQPKIEYIAVIEFQERGAVHYHVVMFNLPYIKADLLQKIWGHGYIKVNRIDRVDNVGAYVVKYMNKDLEDTRLRESKCYLKSGGLKEPEEVTDIEKIKVLAHTLTSFKTYNSTFENDYTGNITYTQYNRNRIK